MPYRSVFRPDLFRDQLIIVTGAGSGIGRCIAHELAALGATTALVGRTLSKLEATAAELTAEGARSSCHTCDIRDEEGVKALVKAVLEQHGRIDGLVNNAGGQFPSPLEKISFKGWEAVVRNNLTGGFLVSREVYLQYMQTHGGSIVNITADFWKGMPNMGHSGAARAGMENLTITSAVEWARSGVRVNGVAPGWIASSGFDTYDPVTQANMKRLKHHLPVKRFGTEAEISAAVVFLLSEAAAFITGETIRVDGAASRASLHWEMPEHDRSKPYEGFHLATLPKALRD